MSARGCLSPAVSRRRPRGVTLVELLVVLGVLMILVGVLLPGLRRSRDSARDIQAASNTRQCVLIVESYAASHDGYYPRREHWHAGTAAAQWWRAARSAGLFDGPGADPNAVLVQIEADSHILCTSFAYDHRLMRPGHTVDWWSAESRWVRTAEVRYPSRKGLARRLMIDWGPVTGHWCCTYIPIRAPIAMADTSIVFGDWTEFLVPPGRYFTENSIGSPVTTTWYGTKGRDR